MRSSIRQEPTGTSFSPLQADAEVLVLIDQITAPRVEICSARGVKVNRELRKSIQSWMAWVKLHEDVSEEVKGVVVLDDWGLHKLLCWVLEKRLLLVLPEYLLSADELLVCWNRARLHASVPRCRPGRQA